MCYKLGVSPHPHPPSPDGGPGGWHGRRTTQLSPSLLAPSTSGLGGSCGGEGHRQRGGLDFDQPKGIQLGLCKVGGRHLGRENRRDRGSWSSSRPVAAFHSLRPMSPSTQLSSLEPREGDKAAQQVHDCAEEKPGALRQGSHSLLPDFERNC